MSTTQSRVPARQNVDALIEEVQRRASDLAVYLPEGVKPERFLALARRAILEQPALAECSASSVLNALARCAASGLELDGRYSSLIVRRSKNGRPTASWSPTYAGCIWQCMASGLVRAVQAEVVHAADVFEPHLGTEPKIVHRPCLTGDPGALVACYAVAELSNGAKVTEILTAEDIRKIAAMSPVASEMGPWSRWPAEMWKKCAIRRLTKRLPAGNTRAPIAPQIRARVGAFQGGTPINTLEPEHANAMECAALAQLADATSIAELDAAWAQAQIEYQQQGAAVPISIESRWHDRREQLAEQEG